MKEANTFRDVAQALRDAQKDGVVHITDTFIRMQDGKIHACAAGAISVGLGITRGDWWQMGKRSYWAQWPAFQRKVVSPGFDTPVLLISAIVYLNDAKGWNFEQIASWLDTLSEPKDMEVLEYAHNTN